jgi:hypothetical protein
MASRPAEPAAKCIRKLSNIGSVDARTGTTETIDVASMELVTFLNSPAP